MHTGLRVLAIRNADSLNIRFFSHSARWWLVLNNRGLGFLTESAVFRLPLLDDPYGDISECVFLRDRKTNFKYWLTNLRKINFFANEASAHLQTALQLT